ncbi:hypothetical protein [Helicobacter trogontum]|uniref:hypothetical protein n=1 Tax=Helicobacter trogontum TaxID=50960 RepID=UPI000AC2CC11|nr:hypothetical protein [Helicobacter trogontum]
MSKNINTAVKTNTSCIYNIDFKITDDTNKDSNATNSKIYLRKEEVELYFLKNE